MMKKILIALLFFPVIGFSQSTYNGLRDSISAYGQRPADFFHAKRALNVLTGMVNLMESGAGGGGGTPGGSPGDIQMKGSPGGFSAAPMNSNGVYISVSKPLKITKDSNLVLKSVTDPNTFYGLSFENSSGTEVAGFKPNMALGHVRMGGFASGYIPVFYSYGSEVGRWYNGGELMVGFTSNHGEKLAVNGQVYVDNLLTLNNNQTQPTSSYHNFSGATTGSSGYGLRDNAGTMEFKNSGGSWTPIPATILASGTYTPTLTSVTNVSSSTAHAGQYLRVGNSITFSVTVDVNTTAAGATELGISLPVASALSSSYELAGTAVNGASLAGTVIGDATNSRASLKYTAAGSGSTTFTIHVTYKYVAP